MNHFERVEFDEVWNAAKARRMHISKFDSIYTNATTLVELLGNPSPGGADGKTDVEFNARYGDEFISIWNYKDGAYVGIDFDMDEDREFSVWYSNPVAFEALKRALS